MKTIIYYQCEICGSRSTRQASVEYCEARGRAVEYPVGTIFNNASQRGNFYKDITLVVASNCLDGHCNDGALWGFRDNGAGDSIHLKDLCGGRSLSLGKHDAPDQDHPTFKRAVAFLKKHKIKPYVWTGKESKPL